jgi:hypothetical protein
MGQFFRIVNTEKNNLQKDQSDNFVPFLEKGQVIKVNFVGLGTVIDRSHYAVVWDAHPTNEHTVVIPLTSKVRAGKGYFEIGPIDGLEAASHVIKSNQPQSISRKSIQIWTKKNEDGQNVVVTLEDWQLRKTEELFRISQLKEPTLVKVLNQFIGLKVPITPSIDYFENLYKPIHYFVLEDKLYYKVYQDAPIKIIETMNIGIRSGERKELLKKLFSEDASQRLIAESSIEDKIKEGLPKS